MKCDVCGREVMALGFGADSQHTALCSNCEGSQPNPDEIDKPPYPCVDGCTSDLPGTACDHGMPTWFSWLGW